MNIYTETGWIDVPAILTEGYPYIFITGGRGTGKTYSSLKEARKRSDPDHRFLLMRRTLVQLELVMRQEFSPFKAIDRDEGFVTISQPITKYTGGFYAGREEDGAWKAEGPALGYSGALSVFSNLRGWSADDVDLVIFDEFIPQPQEKPIRGGDATALWNAMETIGRNRELQGKSPVQLLCLANSNTLGNPIFLDLQLVQVAEKMRDKGREVWTDDRRGIMMILLQQSEISDRKADTALYKLKAGSEFARMSLDNDFAYEERGDTGRIPLKELQPLAAVGEICIYRRKSGGYYVSGHRSGSPETFGTGPHELARFKRKYYWLWHSYMTRKITFEKYVDEILFTKYIG